MYEIGIVLKNKKVWRKMPPKTLLYVYSKRERTNVVPEILEKHNFINDSKFHI